MKWIFGESLKDTASLLQEQLQLAKATGPGHSIKVLMTCRIIQSMSLTFLEESSPGRWLWTVAISATLPEKGAFRRDQS